jgi:hypothetical protein
MIPVHQPDNQTTAQDRDKAVDTARSASPYPDLVEMPTLVCSGCGITLRMQRHGKIWIADHGVSRCPNSGWMYEVGTSRVQVLSAHTVPDWVRRALEPPRE